MNIIIKIERNAAGLPSEVLDGSYVISYDPDANDGFGGLDVTFDKSRARRFSDIEVALAYWKQQSILRPLRDDGAPNRPMTAFTISLEPV